MEPLLFETILIRKGSLQNTKYHELRMKRSRKALFNLNEHIDLRQSICHIPSNGEYRCKVCYSDKIYNIEIKPYRYIEKKSFLLIDADFDYQYKYLDRSPIEYYKQSFPDFDDLIFIKNELVTDTTIANIAIYTDNQWLTPKNPLLRGTMREKLLAEDILKECNITYNDIFCAEKFAVMNALSGFRIIDSPQFTLSNF